MKRMIWIIRGHPFNAKDRYIMHLILQRQEHSINEMNLYANDVKFSYFIIIVSGTFSSKQL